MHDGIKEAAKNKSLNRQHIRRVLKYFWTERRGTRAQRNPAICAADHQLGPSLEEHPPTKFQRGSSCCYERDLFTGPHG